MASVLKIKAPEGNLSSASNVNFAKLVRVLNNKTSVQAITHTDKDGQVIGLSLIHISEPTRLRRI